MNLEKANFLLLPREEVTEWLPQVWNGPSKAQAQSRGQTSSLLLDGRHVREFAFKFHTSRKSSDDNGHSQASTGREPRPSTPPP